MQSVVKKIIMVTCLLLMTAIGLNSCGSYDVLDETGLRYTASIAIQDLDQETLSVDVIQNSCDGDPEPYGPASALVNISVDSNAPGISLREYTLAYIPLPSEDGTGNIVMPPDLDGPLVGGNMWMDIPSGGSSSFSVTCMSVDTKEEFRRKNGWLHAWETAEGTAAIVAKEAEITAQNTAITAQKAAITAKRYEIIDADPLEVPRLELDLEILEEELSVLEAELDILQSELNAIYYSIWSPIDQELDEGRYKIRITFKFIDEFGESRNIVREATVWLGDFNNC